MKQFEELWKNAEAAGKWAGENCKPHAMNITDGKTDYYVSEGVCGFAWVEFAGNTAWGRWAKKYGIARKMYNGGLNITCRDFGQSMERKEAWAFAIVRHLWTEAKIDCIAVSRMD